MHCLTLSPQNSGFVIGLPPKELFRLPSLTSILEPSEAESLLDALDTLDDRDLDPSGTETGPLNFQLSGLGLPGTSVSSDAHSSSRLEWQCHCALHRPDRINRPGRAILEMELMDDQVNPLTTVSNVPMSPDERGGMDSEEVVEPTAEDLTASTVSMVKPLRALARSKNRRGGRKQSGEMDIVELLSQINDQLAKADELAPFLKVRVVGGEKGRELTLCLYRSRRAYSRSSLSSIA
jgi:hypothetical protein